MFNFFNTKKIKKQKPITSVNLSLERPQPNPSLYNGNINLIHYMADLSFNEHNRHRLPRQVVQGIERLPINPIDNLTTPPDHLLTNPDLRSSKEFPSHYINDGKIKLIDWLKLKFSNIGWANDSKYRDTIPRAIMAILMEGEPEKIKVVNDFINSIPPYTGRKHKHTPPEKKPPENLNSISFNFFSQFFHLCGNFLSFLPGYQSSKDIYNAFAEGFEGEFDDFTICMWTKIYYLSEREPQKYPLTAKTKNYMLKHLLKLEGPRYDDTISNTGAFRFWAWLVGYPVTSKGILNSENHLLMINGSAYLKNQITKPNLNKDSELERKLCAHLDALYFHGLSEFNSIPYAGYTIDALLNLHDFAHEPVKSRATRVLDKIFYDYMIHSTPDGKNFPPISRQARKVQNKDYLVDNTIRAFMLTWLGFDTSYYRQEKTSQNAKFALTALATTYRPPQIVYDLAIDSKASYLSITGQRHGNAQISYKNHYTKNTKSGTSSQSYLISGGGVAQTAHILDYTIYDSWLNSNASDRADALMRVEQTAAEVVSRNPTLILDGPDGTFKLDDSFYLGTERAIQPSKEPWGPGIDSKEKNNTGIYFDTMVGPYPVHVPSQFKSKGISPKFNDPISKNWTLYPINSGLRVAVFDGIIPMNQKENKQVGIVMVLPGPCDDAQDLINKIAQENSQINLEHPFYHVGYTLKFPDNCHSVMRGKTLSYNPYTPLGYYAIEGVNQHTWSMASRRFFAAPMPDQTVSSGWSAMSIIQKSPEEDPQHLLHQKPKDTPYTFLNINNTFDNDKKNSYR